MKHFYPIFFLLLSCSAYAQTDTSSTLGNIHQEVDRINADNGYVVKKLDGEQFQPHATDGGGELSGYYKNGQLVKIVERIGLSSCVEVTEYYIQNGQLIYVYRVGKEFEYNEAKGTFDANKQETTLTCWCFLENKEVLLYHFNGQTRCSGTPTADWPTLCLEKHKRYAALLAN